MEKNRNGLYLSNYFIHDGKKEKIEQILVQGIPSLPFPSTFKLLGTLKPTVAVVSKKSGRRNVEIPNVLSPRRQTLHLIRFIREAMSLSKMRFATGILEELKLITNKQSVIYKKKLELHKKAIENLYFLKRKR